MVKVAFYKGRKRLFNRLTCWWLRGLYSHCEIVFEDGSAASSSFLDGGVRFKRIDFDPDHWDFMGVDADADRVWAWFLEHQGEGYDLLGLAGFVARVIRHDQYRWVCSEACMAALGYPDPWRFDPCSMAAVLKA